MNQQMRMQMKYNMNAAVGGLYEYNSTMFQNGKESTRKIKEAIRNLNSMRLGKNQNKINQERQREFKARTNRLNNLNTSIESSVNKNLGRATFAIETSKEINETLRKMEEQEAEMISKLSATMATFK